MIHRDTYWSQAQTAAGYLGESGMYPVDVVLQCGSGLSGLAGKLFTNGLKTSMDAIPHFPAGTVTGHGREAVFGRAGGLSVLILTGRIHLYEGHDPLTAGFPAAVAKACGARLFILTNAAGALSTLMNAGEMMIHSDFINMQGDNALAHLTPSNIEDSFVDPKPAYHPAASQALKRALQAAMAKVHEGVYVGVRGPVYETLAELKMLKSFGADATGMSSIPELTVAHAFKLPVAGISVITNQCSSGRQVNHAAVVEASREATPKLAAGTKAFLEDKSWRKNIPGLEDKK